MLLLITIFERVEKLKAQLMRSVVCTKCKEVVFAYRSVSDVLYAI
jgi:hypothetical protein